MKFRSKDELLASFKCDTEQTIMIESFFNHFPKINDYLDIIDFKPYYQCGLTAQLETYSAANNGSNQYLLFNCFVSNSQRSQDSLQYYRFYNEVGDIILSGKNLTLFTNTDGVTEFVYNTIIFRNIYFRNCVPNVGSGHAYSQHNGIKAILTNGMNWTELL